MKDIETNSFSSEKDMSAGLGVSETKDRTKSVSAKGEQWRYGLRGQDSDY